MSAAHISGHLEHLVDAVTKGEDDSDEGGDLRQGAQQEEAGRVGGLGPGCRRALARHAHFSAAKAH